MRANREKLMVAIARACICVKELALAANMPESTVKNVIYGRRVRPGTLGRIARALGVDVTEIMEDVRSD